MKRRDFLLSAGTLLTISFSLTATGAQVVDSVSPAADFRVLPDSQSTATSLETIPTSANQASDHVWEVQGLTVSEDVDTITAAYPTGTRFDGLSDKEITVELDRTGDGNLKKIKVNKDSYFGSSATFDLSGNFNTNIAGRAKITIEGIENPDSGVYSPELTFTANTDNPSFEADMGITNDSAFYTCEITNAPATVSGGDQFTADYTVTNEGDGSGNQTVSVTVDGTEQDNVDLTLAPGESYNSQVTYTTSADDAPEIDLTVASNDSSDSQAITITGVWNLGLSPAKQNSNSTHTWSTGFVQFQGEVDTITTAYPGGNQGASFDGLTDDDITVKITRDGEASPTEISVNSDSYSGSTATFDLSGIYNTDIDGEVIVEISGITNPNKGDYQADIVLDGQNDTRSFTVQFSI